MDCAVNAAMLIQYRKIMCTHAGTLLSELHKGLFFPSYLCHLTSFSPLRWASLSFCRVWAMAQPFSPPPHVDTQSPNSFTSFSWVVAERGVVVPTGGRLDRRRLDGEKREDHMIAIYHITASFYHICMNRLVIHVGNHYSTYLV